MNFWQRMWTRKPQSLAAMELTATRRARLEAESNLESCQAMVEMLKKREVRLTMFVAPTLGEANQ